MTAHKPTEYKAIELWGINLGSYRYYIEGEQHKAADMDAPIDALYERNGNWVCVSDLSPTHRFHEQYRNYLKVHKMLA
jgi:hypothetical protein